MMRTAAFVLTGALVAAGCAAQSAYGPSSDDRLDMATNGIGTSAGSPDVANAEHLAKIGAQACDRPAAALAKLAGGQATEEERLAALTGLLQELRAHKTALDTEFESHPGLKYFSGKAADGRAYDVPQLVNRCETSLYDAEARLDGLVRDVVRMPVVESFEGKGRRRRAVPQARVDFALLQTAVTTLAPVDESALVAEIAAAQKRLEDEKKHKRRRRRRRRR